MSSTNDGNTPENGGSVTPPISNGAWGERVSAPRRAAMNNPFSLESAAEAMRAEKEESRYTPRGRSGNDADGSTAPSGERIGNNAQRRPSDYTVGEPGRGKNAPGAPERGTGPRTAARNPGESVEEWAKRAVAEYVREIDELDTFISISPEIRSGENLSGITFIMGGKDMGSTASYEETVNKVRYAAKIARRRRDELENGSNTRRRVEANPGSLFTTAERDRFSQGNR